MNIKLRELTIRYAWAWDAAMDMWRQSFLTIEERDKLLAALDAHYRLEQAALK